MPAMLATRPLLRDPAAAAGERGRAWLNNLYGGQFDFPALLPFLLPTGERSAPEHDAVARAAGCRDLFIIHADIPAGVRVISDLARVVTERVLILTPDSEMADRLCEHLLKLGLPVLRALAEDENPIRPSRNVSRITSRAIGDASIEKARNEAIAAVSAAEQRYMAFASVSKAIARLTEVNEQLAKLNGEIETHQSRKEQVAEEARAAVIATLATEQGELETSDRLLTEEIARLTTEQTAKEKNLIQSRQEYAAATRKPGLLARLFGRKPAATASQASELDLRLRSLEAELKVLSGRVAELQSRRENAVRAFTAKRDEQVAAETAVRRASLDSVAAIADAERGRLQAEAAALNSVIGVAVPGDDHVAAERQLAAARAHAAEASAATADQIARAVAEPRIVIGTPASVDSDPAFMARADDPPFGLLILDRAEELPEAEFARLAQLGERWVLVGEVIPREEQRVSNGRAPSRNGRVLEVPFVTRLAKWLDRETWMLEADRLVCRLVHMTPDQRRDITREPLVDRPDIDLHFTASESDPLLAEIAFPASAGVHAAKSFLFHTLGEVLLRPCGNVVWKHDGASISAIWPGSDTEAEGVWIDLDPGVREKVCGAGLFAYTAAVTFDLSAGWDAEKAAAWLARYLPPPATSRFAALPRSPGPRPNR